MKGRDLLILTAVVLVAGFAVADAIRTQGSPERPAKPETQRTATESVVPEPSPELGRERFEPVPGAPGSLVFTETGDCPVREFRVGSGDELANVIPRSTCELWAAPVTARIAVSIAQPQGDGIPFRFIDLARSGRNLGTSSAFFGFLVWSPDGQRAAWCNARRVGIDLELLGGEKRRLPQCPIGYTAENEVAFADGRRLVTEGRTLLRASGTITFANFGNHGSIAIGVEGRRVDRYVGGRRTGFVALTGSLEGRVPTFSPDNCSALVRTVSLLRPLDLGCSSLGDRAFAGFAAAWSPDGRFLAVASPGRLSFFGLEDGRRELARWPVTAIDLAWR